MDHVRHTGVEGVVSYVAHDGRVVATRSPVAPLGPGDVRVEVELTTLGSWAWPTGQGIEPLGDTFVGRIVECGSEVSPERLCTRVLGIVRSGAAATHLVVPSFGAHVCREGSPAGTAAAMVTSGVVACCLADAIELEPGSVAVVTSASFGVSCVLAGLLRARGAEIVGVREHDGDISPLLAAGCRAVLGPDARPRGEALRGATGGRLADRVIDAGRSPSPWAEIEPMLAPSGIAVTWASTQQHDWDPARSRSLGVIAELARQYAATGDVVGELAERIRTLVSEAVAGRLVLPVHEFEPAQVQEAFDLTRDPSTIGRVALRLSPGP